MTTSAVVSTTSLVKSARIRRTMVKITLTIDASVAER